LKYPFVRPVVPRPESWLGDLEEAYARRYFTNFGAQEQKLTALLAARFAGPDTAVTLTCNATAGLTAALIASGVQGKVVVPAFTFPATLQAVLAARCEPVLSDVDPNTWEMSEQSLAAVLRREKCAAAMPVRVFGLVRDLSPLLRTAAEHGLEVVVDAAAALGVARVQAQPNVCEVFSLHATKSFGIGEGGAIFAQASRKQDVVAALNFGLDPQRRFGFGINGKMSELQAVVGLALASELTRLVAGRRTMAERYDVFLARYPVTLPAQRGPTAWSNYPLLLPRGADAAKVEEEGMRRGLQIRRYYFPSLGRGYKGSFGSRFETPVADELSERAICFPLYADASDEELEEILAIAAQALQAGGVRA
jgi:dTDP-4-amino-4,6-dideoxygalactose transaminase